MIEFRVDRGQKRSLARSRMFRSFGGIVGIAVGILLIVFGFVAAWYLVNFTPGLSRDPEDGAWPEAVAVATCLIALGVIAIAATWRAMNVGVSMNKRELLTFDGRLLEYSFHPGLDNWPTSRIFAKIDMGEIRVAFDPAMQRYRFFGDIRWHHYLDPQRERLLGFQEMEPTDTYEIGAYFGREFDEFMSGYIQA